MNKQFYFFAFILFLSVGAVRAQQKVFDGTLPNGTSMPNKDALFELESKFKGLLFSRVELVATNLPAPLQNHVAGMMVYNTTSNSTIKPGIFYNDGSKWIAVGGSNATGNIHYDPTTYIINYIDETGNPVVIDLPAIIVANQTITTLINNGDGTYTYTSEDGSTQKIDVPADVINNFKEIIDKTEVQDILNQFINENAGNVSYNGTSFTYVDANGDTHVIDLSELIKETITTLINNGDGTYTYISENGSTTIIDVPADVANNFQEIINNTEVKNILEQFINENAGNVIYNGSEFTYVDGSGNTQIIDLTELIKLAETVTTLTNNGDGTYTYTSENGSTTIIDVPADVINNFQEIVDNTEVKNILEQFINENAGNVIYNGSEFTYVDGSGNTQIIDLTELIKLAETVTTLTNNGDGTYTYTSENGSTTVIDVPADVVNNFQEIVDNTEVKNILEQFINENAGNVIYNGSEFTYVDGSGNTQIIDLTELVKLAETVTTLTNNGDGTYTYTSENGSTTIIDVPADVINNFQEIVDNTEVKNILEQFINENAGNVIYNGSEFTYVDGSGNTQIIDLTELIKLAETVTTLTNNGDGTYTYTSENGSTTIIDVPADVINNFQEIVDNTEVKNILEQFINENAGNVIYNGSEFTYVDGSGNTQIIDLTELVKLAETVTTLTNNGDGTYTYTSENGSTTIIDVPADVINNFQEIVDNSEVKNILEQFINENAGNVIYNGSEFTYVDGSGNTQIIDLTELIKLAETVTTLTNNGDGTYTYTSENGSTTIIDVPADVINNFQEIVDNTEVKNILEQFINENAGNVIYNGSEFTYVDGSGNTQIIDLTELIKLAETVTTLTNNGDGTYTYTSENGSTTVIDVPADVVNNFQEIVDNSEVKNILEQFINEHAGGDISFDGTSLTFVDGSNVSQTINLVDFVKQHETITFFKVDELDGTYSYTAEDGIVTVIDIKKDMVRYFDEVINDPFASPSLAQFIYKKEDNISYEGDRFVYHDASGVLHTIDPSDLIDETVTTLTNNGDGTYTYTSENGSTTIIDVPADVIENFQNIVLDGGVQNILEQIIKQYAGSDISFDGTYLTFVDGSGVTQTINIVDLIKSHETVTTLVNNGDGKYTYTSENGSTTVIDVPADVINNFQEIVSNGDVQNILEQIIKQYAGSDIRFDGTTLTYVDGSGVTQTINLVYLIKSHQTVTTLVNNGDGTYTYTSENGTTTKIDVPADVINSFQEIVSNGGVQNILEQIIKQYAGGDISFDGTNLTFVDGSGVTQTINIVDLIKSHETVTTLTYDDAAGAYTYTNEKGVPSVISAKQDVTNFFENAITSSSDNKQFLIDFITSTPNMVQYSEDSGTFYYIDGNGDTQILELSELNILTTLVNNGDGTYTYTSENGSKTTIDVPADVIQNFQNIIDDSKVENILKQFINEHAGNVNFDGTVFTYFDNKGDVHNVSIGDLVRQNETVTYIDYEEIQGVYTYFAEGNLGWAINVGPDISRFFQKAVNDTKFGNSEFLKEFIRTTPEMVRYNNSQLMYVDGSGTLQHVDLKEAAAMNYSDDIQETGRKWVTGETVKEVTFIGELTTPGAEFTLPADVPSRIQIIGIRVIHRSKNSVSTNLVGYDRTTKIMTVGMPGSVTGMHPVGAYDIIVEYFEL